MTVTTIEKNSRRAGSVVVVPMTGGRPRSVLKLAERILLQSWLVKGLLSLLVIIIGGVGCCRLF